MLCYKQKVLTSSICQLSMLVAIGRQIRRSYMGEHCGNEAAYFKLKCVEVQRSSVSRCLHNSVAVKVEL